MVKRNWKSDLEAIAAIGSGALLDPVAGLVGLGGAAWPGPQGQGARAVEAVRGLGYEPRNPATLEAIGNLLKTPLEYYTKGMDYVGDKTVEATGSPLLGSIAGHSPELIGTVLGLKGLRAPRVRPGPHEILDETVDQSRRQFLKRAGLTAAAAPVLGPSLVKGLLDGGAAVETAASKAAPIATTAARAAVAAAELPAYAISPNAFRLVSLAKAFPEADIKSLFQFVKDGEGTINDGLEGMSHGMWQDFDTGLYDELGKHGLRDLDTELSYTLGQFDEQDMIEALHILNSNDTSKFKLDFDIPDELKPHYQSAIDSVNPDWGASSLLDEVASSMRYGFDEDRTLFDPFTNHAAVLPDSHLKELTSEFNGLVESGDLELDDWSDFISDKLHGD